MRCDHCASDGRFDVLPVLVRTSAGPRRMHLCKTDRLPHRYDAVISTEADCPIHGTQHTFDGACLPCEFGIPAEA